MLLVAMLSGCVRVLDLTESDTAVTDPVCVPGDFDGFAMPDARWALAALHAERTFDRLPDSRLSELDADYVLAAAWQHSGFGCDDHGFPWVEEAQFAGGPGCLGITESVVWIELCRLYPGRYSCAAYPAATAGDRIEAQVMAFTWFALAAHALLGRYDDPDVFTADPADPRRMSKVMSIAHYRTPWFAFEGCTEGTDGFDTCLDPDLERHVDGVEDKRDRLRQADCWEGALTEADVREYIAGLAAIQPDPDWEAAEAAAVAAVRTGRFSDDASGVLDAIDTVATTRLFCPESTLSSVYGLPCP